MKRPLQLSLGIALAALFLWLILRHIDTAELLQALAGAHAGWLTAAVALFYVGYACRIERWHIMLTQGNPRLRWRHCAGPLMASVAANNVLPFRAGDLLRAFGFNRRLGIDAATSLTTLMVERLLDLLMVIALLAAALTWFGVEAGAVVSMSGGVLGALALVILVVLLFPARFRRPAETLARFVGRFSARLGERLLAELQKVFAAMAHTSQARTMYRLVAWSLAAWLFEAGVFYCVARALAGLAQPAAAWLATPVGTLATVIPSTPGYVGTFDFFTARAMTAAGNAPTPAAAYAFLVHAVLWLPPTLAGGLYLMLRPLSLDERTKSRT